MTFRIAHISDVHLAPLPPVKPSEMTSKRIVGYNSWMFRRKAIHDPRIAIEIVRDIKAAQPGHVMVTGDLVNIALPREFINGESWLRNLGKPDWVSFVPGNHDAYVPVQWDKGMGRLGDYMTGGFFWWRSTLNYVAQWVEPDGLKANIVTLPYRKGKRPASAAQAESRG